MMLIGFFRSNLIDSLGPSLGPLISLATVHTSHTCTVLVAEFKTHEQIQM